MRKTISLNGSGWRCAESQLQWAAVNELEHIEARSFPACVPGEVRLDLARAGLLEGDIFYGCNSQNSRWVEERDWWYWRDFDLALQRGQRAWLRLHGADYVCWVYLNGRLLGQHEGMFSRQVYEITHLLRGCNRLAARFLAPARLPRNRSTLLEKLLNRIEDHFSALGDYAERRDVLKCQMSFGWDFAPALRTLGLWDDVDVIVTGEVTLFDLQAQFDRTENTLAVSFDAEALTPGSATFALSLAGQTFDTEPVTRSFEAALPGGRSRLTFKLAVPQPRLWFPWDHGEPHLYTLTVEAQRGGGALDCTSERIGLRKLALRRNPGSPPGATDWTFVVNGQPVYLRGANWAPADAIPARVTEADYGAWLGMARAANLNALRVWGGGLREKKAFYALCDQMGLMVWQEFPLACAFLTRYPRSAEYLALVERETRSIVRQLRNHPSLVMWCGGNEFSPQRNQPVIETMRRAALDEDGTRPFHPASPFGGESHNWLVWHEFHPPEDYQRDNAQLMSEFGLQSPPSVASLRRFIPPAELEPPGPSWAHHRAQLDKLFHYACPYARPFQELAGGKLKVDDLLSTFVVAAQLAQARGIQIAIEHARRKKYATSGFFVWQFNSPWPAIDWALVDYYGAPKLAYHRLAQVANPLLVCLDYPLRRYAAGEALEADVWVVNDWPRQFAGCRVEIALQRFSTNDDRPLTDGHPAPSDLRQIFDLDVEPDSAKIIGRIAWRLPEGDWSVECCLMQGEHELAINRYNLNEYDGRRPPLRHRLWRWLTGGVIRLMGD